MILTPPPSYPTPCRPTPKPSPASHQRILHHPSTLFHASAHRPPFPYAPLSTTTCVSCSQAPSQLDEDGWSACHHAIDATSYSWRAARAADNLIGRTPLKVLDHQITGSKCTGFTCLHLCSDGSDINYKRSQLARKLVLHGANLHARTAKGSTPLLLASGSGVTDVLRVLRKLGGDVDDKNNRQMGVFQAAAQCSSSSTNEVRGGRRYKWVPPERQWKTTSESRASRELQHGWRSPEKRRRRS